MAYGIRANEEALTAATNVSRSSRVRVFNSGAAALLMTVRDSEGTQIGTMTIGSGQAVDIWKDVDDTLEGGADLLASAVSTAG